MIDKYLRSAKDEDDAALFWFETDRAHLNLEGDALISINTSDETTQIIDDENKKKFKTFLSQKVNIANTITEKGILSQLVGAYFTLAGQHYAGQLVFDSQRIVNVDIKTSEKRHDSGMEAETCSSAKLIGALSMTQTQTVPVQWEYPCKWLPQSIADVKVPQILQQVLLSPSGKYFFHKITLYNVEQNGDSEEVLGNYPDMISATINPDWTLLAVFAGKDKKYRVDIFELQIE